MVKVVMRLVQCLVFRLLLGSGLRGIGAHTRFRESLGLMGL